MKQEISAEMFQFHPLHVTGNAVLPESLKEASGALFASLPNGIIPRTRSGLQRKLCLICTGVFDEGLRHCAIAGPGNTTEGGRTDR